jgi:hypothetical protein
MFFVGWSPLQVFALVDVGVKNSANDGVSETKIKIRTNIKLN